MRRKKDEDELENLSANSDSNQEDLNTKENQNEIDELYQLINDLEKKDSQKTGGQTSNQETRKEVQQEVRPPVSTDPYSIESYAPPPPIKN